MLLTSMCVKVVLQVQDMNFYNMHFTALARKKDTKI